MGDPDLNGPRRLEVSKTNLCRYPPPLGLVFEKGTGSVPTLRYFAQPEDPPPTHAQLCAAWLLDFLTEAGGPVRPCEVVAAAGQAGFPRPTLYRVLRALTGRIVDVGSSRRDPNKRWAIIVSPEKCIQG